jgi:hypothetical protein
MPDKTNLPVAMSSQDLIADIASHYPIISPEDFEGLGIQRALQAETLTAVLAMPESVSLDEITGTPFWLLGIDFFTYSAVKTREKDLYAYINCYWDNGVGFQATTGSGYALGRVHRCAQLNGLPRRVMSLLVESKRTPGQSSLWIVDAPEGRTNGAQKVIDTTGEIISDKDVAADEPF